MDIMYTHKLAGVHTLYLDCTDEMQKTKRRKGGVQGEAEKKMRCSKKKWRKCGKPEKRECRRQKKVVGMLMWSQRVQAERGGIMC